MVPLPGAWAHDRGRRPGGTRAAVFTGVRFVASRRRIVRRGSRRRRRKRGAGRPGRGCVAQEEEEEKVEKVQEGWRSQPQGGPFQQEGQKRRQGVPLGTLKPPRQERPSQEREKEETFCGARWPQEEEAR